MTDDLISDQKPFCKYDVLRCQTKQVKQKSSAQVESLVLPQAVLPNSCGLKPEMSNRRHRPKKQKKPVKRSSPLSVRLSDKDRAIIVQKAFNIGYSVNAYVRAAALGSDYKPPMNRELFRAIHAANRELTMQGVNLNQIAKHLNGGQVRLDETEGLLGQIARSIFKTHEVVGQVITQGKMWPEEES